MKQSRKFGVIGCLALAVAFDAGAAEDAPASQETHFECRAKSSNEGCAHSARCPSGTTIRAARAACNLEHGLVSDERLSSVERGYLEVVRSSDRVDEGSCWLGPTQVESGRSSIQDIIGSSEVSIGCREHDRNGGDCQIRGTLYCQ